MEGESQRLTGTAEKGDETDKIRDRLDDGENVVMWVRQSRIKPGSVGGINPNSIFVTEKRVIIRSPVTFGLGEHIEEYFYRQITNVRLEKGVMSASPVFYIPGMAELSKGGQAGRCGGRGERGTIDAIPKKDAEKIYGYVREKIREAKEAPGKRQAAEKPKSHRRPASDSKGEVRQGRDHKGGAYDDDQRPDRPVIPMPLSTEIRPNSNHYIETHLTRCQSKQLCTAPFVYREVIFLKIE